MRSYTEQLNRPSRLRKGCRRIWRFLTLELEGPRIDYPKAFIDFWPEDYFPACCRNCGYKLRRNSKPRCPKFGGACDRNEIIASDYLPHDEWVADVIGTPWLKRLKRWHVRFAFVWLAVMLVLVAVQYVVMRISTQQILAHPLSGDTAEAALRHNSHLGFIFNLINIGLFLLLPLGQWWIHVLRRRAIRRDVRQIDCDTQQGSLDHVQADIATGLNA